MLARELAPDLVIMDITMPGLNGMEATRQIRAEGPGIKVLALSMHSDLVLVVEMLKVGAAGFLLKDCVFAELIRAVELVLQGKTYLTPDIAGLHVEDYLGRQSAPELPTGSLLTAREREVLQFLAEGQSTKQIAATLSVSGKTVGTHRENIMRKLGIGSIAGLARFAVRAGLTSLEKFLGKK